MKKLTETGCIFIGGTKMNKLYYGDNLEVLRRKIKDETIDLCYIDPPFNSKRNYNQIYNNIGSEDRAQAQAFTDTWVWDSYANAGYAEIIDNKDGRFQPPLVELIKGLHAVLGKGSLFAYLVSMSLRVMEIHRVLKNTGSFYLHCDPTSSHYLKLILDAVFCSGGGDFRNEIIWHYRRWTGKAKKFQELHDVIFFYTKSDKYTFNVQYTAYTEKSLARKQNYHTRIKGDDIYVTHIDEKGVRENDVWQIQLLNSQSLERLGYPTQKPEALLDRIIKASTNEGDIVLDAYCGCGTTVAVAQRLKRQWLGIDITYQSISLILRRLEKTFGTEILAGITIDGIPRDMNSAQALAHKKDDRLRKEFEKWAVLTYTNNRAIINEKKGADAGIDGIAYFKTGKMDNTKIVFQVKSGGVSRGDIAKLRGDMEREQATLAIFITLEEPTRSMISETKAVGQYKHEDMGRSYDRISIVTIKEIVEGGKRLEIPMSLEVLAAAKRTIESEQINLL